MSDADWARVADLFEELLELEPAAREAELEQRCGTDAALAAAVRELLAEHDVAFADRFLSAPPPLAIENPLAAGLAGALVGGFRLIREIGHGGMGVVFEAEQEHPRRRVAVKVMKPFFSSGSALRRFEVEAEILGRLKHPAIAQVIAAGVHRFETSGLGFDLPWTAMELLDGARPLVEDAESRGIETNARLVVFRTVLDAVSHAHQRGVIHRDLKPANILVDASGAPKVIDFGIARTTQDEATRQTLATRAGELLGTLCYMAPEQVDGRADQVDVRTDVYALGVVLCELVAGSPPLAIDDSTLDVAVRTIRVAPPRRPSQLRAGLPRELDWIVARCLEKEPDQRYASVADLALDIDRFLRREPLSVGPPGVGYRARAFVRRHRFGVTIAALVLVVLASWIVSLRSALDRALHAEAEAREAGRIAQTEADKAGAVRGLMQYAIGDAAGGRSAEAIPLKDVLKRMEAAVGRHDSPPAVDAAICISLAEIRTTLGEVDEADRLLDRALAMLEAAGLGDSIDARDAQLKKAAVQRRQGRLNEAAATLSRAALTGEDERDRPAYAESSAYEQILLLIADGRPAAAEPLAREAIARLTAAGVDPGGNRPVFENALARILQLLGRYDEAAEQAEAAIAGEDREHADKPARAANARSTLATIWLEAGRTADAERLAGEALDVMLRELGPDHRGPLGARSTLARAASARGDHERALAEARDVLARRESVSGKENADCVVDHILVAEVLLAADRPADAEAELLAAAAVAAKTLREQHPLRGVVEACRGRALLAQGRVEEGRVAFDAALAILRTEFAADHPRIRAIEAWRGDGEH